MRFMMLMLPKGYEQAKPGTLPDTKAIANMMKYNEELQKAGVLLALEGLHPPSMGARVSFADGKPKITDVFITQNAISIDTENKIVVTADRIPRLQIPQNGIPTQVSSTSFHDRTPLAAQPLNARNATPVAQPRTGCSTAVASKSPAQ